MSRSIFFRLYEMPYKIVMLLVLILPFGCGHRIYYEPDYTNRFYVPRQIPINPGMIQKPGFDICEIVNIVNAQINAENVPLRACNQEYNNLGAYTHKWWGNLHLWTDTAVGVLKTELEKRGVTVTKRAPKTLKLSITRVCLFWAFHDVGCPLSLSVQTGDGYIRKFEVSNKSIDLYDSCDGAITRAVAAMFDDDNIRNYLTCPKAPKDSDCDRVPDEIDECPGTPEGVKVDSRGCPLDSDGDGVPDYLDECPGTPGGIEVDGKGCPLDTDGDGAPDYTDECPGTPEGAKVDYRGCWVLMDTLFDFDRYEIRPEYYPVINEAVVVLQNNPSMKIEVQGHTCNMGTAEYNRILSENRAGSVMNYLVWKGIEEKRLSAVGYGLTRPKTSNETEAARALNRRVELSPVR